MGGWRWFGIHGAEAASPQLTVTPSPLREASEISAQSINVSGRQKILVQG